MSRYTGKATLCAADGTSCAARVDLFEEQDPFGGLPSWRGQLTAEDEAVLWVAVDQQGAWLLIGERRGDVVISADTLGGRTARVTGSGDPPF